MRKFLLLLFCMGPLLFFSQAPGYMGKRFVAGYGFNMSPALIGATPKDNRLNVIHEFYIDHAVSSKWLIGFCMRYYRTIYDNRVQLSDLRVKPENYYMINGFSYALNFKYFKRNYIAPWGSYFMMSPVINMVRAKYDPYMHIRGRVNNHDTLYSDFGPSIQTFTHFDFMFGWGKSRIIADKFSIDYGINFQLVSMFTVLLEADGFFSSGAIVKENYIEMTHNSRVRGINRVNLFLKVGYLF